MKNKLKLVVYSIIFSLNLSWTTPLIISDSGINYDPYVFVNNEGYASVAWISGDYPDLKTQISIYNGTEWSSFTTIEHLENSTQVSPVCGMDAVGNLIVAWECIDETGRKIVSAQKELNGEWQNPITLSTSKSNTSLCLAINSFGEIIVGWIDQENDAVQIITFEIGKNWSDINTISTDGRNGNLQLGIDNNGNGILVWEESNTGSIFSSQTLSGFNSNWSKPIKLNINGINTNPSLNMNSGGNAIATWTNLQTSNVVAAIYENGSWQESIELSNNYSDYPKGIATGSDFIVSWKDLETDDMLAIKNISGSWEKLVNLSSENSYEQYSSSSKSLFTVWNDSYTNDMYISEYPLNGPPLALTVIKSEDLNISPIIESSDTLSVLASESIVGVDHVIKVSVMHN